jgi:AhpD family alkylhydroperoxidase
MKRIDYLKVNPEAVKTLFPLEKYLSTSGLEKSLLNLIKLRASLINGCAYCINMHYKEAIASGELQQRLNCVSVFRDTPFFNEREHAALAWTEAVTNISETHAPDHLYEEVLKHFNDKEAIDLTLAIIAINSWNRLAISFRKELDSNPI